MANRPFLSSITCVIITASLAAVTPLSASAVTSTTKPTTKPTTQPTTQPTTKPTTNPTTKPAAKAPAPNPQLPAVVRSRGDNGTVEVKDVSRIVALNGDVNEILFALGLGDNIIANDVTATYPTEATKKLKIGYGRQLSSEGILALKPTLIIGNEDAGPPSVLAQLRSTNIPVVIVPAGDDVADAGKKIRWVGAAVGLATQGDTLADSVERDIQKVQQRWASSARRMEPKAVFLYLRGPKTQLLGGAGTRAHAMLSAAGAIDAGAYLAGVTGYVPITSEALVKARPDTIVVLEDGLASVGGIDGLLKVPGVVLTPAGQKRRVLAFDDLKLLELGPRTAQALEELNRGLYADQ